MEDSQAFMVRDLMGLGREWEWELGNGGSTGGDMGSVYDERRETVEINMTAAQELNKDESNDIDVVVTSWWDAHNFNHVANFSGRRRWNVGMISVRGGPIDGLT